MYLISAKCILSAVCVTVFMITNQVMLVSSVEVLIDEQTVFTGLYFQDAIMLVPREVKLFPCF